MNYSMVDFKGSWAKVPVQAVMRNGQLSPAEKVLLLYLMSFEKVHPSMAAIMEATDMGESQVRAALKSLQSMGVIDWRKGGPGQPNVYTIYGPDCWSLRAPNTRGEEYRKKLSKKQQSRREKRTKVFQEAVRKLRVVGK